jgi:uncharacterized protein
MPTAQARIPTTQSQRYLTQLCDHLGHMRHGSTGDHHRQPSGHGGPAVQRVEHDGPYGEIVFDWGTCTLQALDDALLIRADAADEAKLKAAQAMFAHRIQTIGRREHLTVNWQ